MNSADTSKTTIGLLSRVAGQQPTWEEARAICHAILHQYWIVIQSRYRHPWEIALCKAERLSLSGQTLDTCRQVGNDLADMSGLDAGYALGNLYAALLPKDVRTRFGVFYTPPGLASRLIDLAEEHGVDWETARILDPACGGGAFLAAVAARMKMRLGHLSPTQLVSLVASNLQGFEIDPFSAWMSQVLTELVLMPECRKARTRLPHLVQVTDALDACHLAESYDLVIGNPPYGRVRLAPEQRAYFARGLFGHANLYALFTDQALRLLNDRGVLGFVAPTSFLAGEYFKKLRALLLHHARPRSIEIMETRRGVFDAALQETLLLVCQKGARHRAAKLRSLSVTPDRIAATELGRFRMPATDHEPWLLPRSPCQVRVATATATLPHRLSDIGYRVKTGPLVWNRHKEQLRAVKTSNGFPLIWAEAILPGGGFRFRAKKQNHLPYVEVHAGQEWLVTRMPCAILQRTTSREQRRRLIAGELPQAFLKRHQGAVIENHLNLLLPTDGTPAISIRTLIAFLNSKTIDTVFRCLSGSVAVSAYELEALPLPDPRALKELESLVQGGASQEIVETFLQTLYGADSFSS